MKNKIILGLAAAGTALAMLPLLAAFEAHVVNVTATIENALELRTSDISFGTTFPEEVFDLPLVLALSQSFLDEKRVDDVEYVIRQKPKCWNNDPQNPVFGVVTEEDEEFVCVNPDFEILPLLCPFLSKHPDITPTPGNDESLDAFHGPITNWTPADTIDNEVEGVLSKVGLDTIDSWKIDLHVPCFEGSCAQDNVIAPEYQLDPELEHSLFGCDLWIETTGISLSEF